MDCGIPSQDPRDPWDHHDPTAAPKMSGACNRPGWHRMQAPQDRRPVSCWVAARCLPASLACQSLVLCASAAILGMSSSDAKRSRCALTHPSLNVLREIHGRLPHLVVGQPAPSRFQFLQSSAWGGSSFLGRCFQSYVAGATILVAVIRQGHYFCIGGCCRVGSLLWSWLLDVVVHAMRLPLSRSLVLLAAVAGSRLLLVLSWTSTWLYMLCCLC